MPEIPGVSEHCVLFASSQQDGLCTSTELVNLQNKHTAQNTYSERIPFHPEYATEYAYLLAYPRVFRM